MEKRTDNRISVEEIIYRWANQSGMIILNESSKKNHLEELMKIEGFTSSE